jgi:ferredoxin
MRVTVRRDLCESNGLCTGVAPQVFQLAADDTLEVLVDLPDEAVWPSVREAAQLCPRGAIILSTGSTPLL